MQVTFFPILPFCMCAKNSHKGLVIYGQIERVLQLMDYPNHSTANICISDAQARRFTFSVYAMELDLGNWLTKFASFESISKCLGQLNPTCLKFRHLYFSL